MAAFILLDLEQFLPAFDDVAGRWPDVRKTVPDRRAAARIFTALSPLRDLLTLPRHVDYYQPERAARSLVTLQLLPEPIRCGGLAYALRMLRSAHAPTSGMGAELTGSAASLDKWLELPAEVVGLLRERLKDRNFNDAHPWGAAELINEWLKAGANEPLRDWLESQALQAAANHPI